MKSYKIVLASASPRRIKLLSEIVNREFDIIPSQIDESFDAGMSIEYVALKLAQGKALSVFERVAKPDKNIIVLGADTLVAIDGKILGKPNDAKDAENMFRLLCGKTHEVVTAVCIVARDNIVKNYDKTYVSFNAFDDEIVYNYIKSGKCFDKAGGYGIQDKELSPLIKGIDGSLSNVIGLPLELTKELLQGEF